MIETIGATKARQRRGVTFQSLSSSKGNEQLRAPGQCTDARCIGTLARPGCVHGLRFFPIFSFAYVSGSSRKP